MRRDLQEKHDRKILITDSPDVWELYGSIFFMLDWYVCMVRCGRPAVFVWLCKLHTIEDHPLCLATVVSSTNILKDEESRCLHVVLFWRVCSMYTRSTAYVLDK